MIGMMVPCGSEEEAIRIAEELLKQRLVGCANVWPVSSRYWWKGELAKEQEWMLFVKTSDKLSDSVQGAVKAMHSYDVPAIERISMKANGEYEEWLQGELSK